VLLLVLTLLSGCATTPPGEEAYDPIEPFNRDAYRFNDSLDKTVLKPVASTYVDITPDPIRIAVSNFFDNIGYLNAVLNQFLQGKFREGGSDAGRFVINSTLGILGLFDVATPMGFPKHEEDFGQTLGVWGAGSGAYLMIPLLGPSTVRDAPGWPVTAVTNVLFYVSNPAVTVPLSILGVIDARARATGAFEFVEVAALDPYIFIREAYLQRRTFLIYDGNPPLPTYLEEPDDEAALPP
jgi:phospholipid-binding lipoprotein MlaA